MSVLTQTKPPSSALAANFRLWAQYVHDVLALGWVQTADTGQIVISAATAPTTNVLKGYEIWRMNDTLQATAPIFMRVEYWGGTAAAANPHIKLSFGTGSNGAGVLTATNLSSVINIGSGVASTTLKTCYGCAAANRVAMALFSDAATGYKLGFVVERTKDNTGADTATGIVVAWWDASDTNSALSYAYIPGQTVQPGNVQAFITPAGSGVNGANLGLCPALPFNFGYLNPLSDVMAYYQYDITNDLTTMAASAYGVSHNYIALGVALGIPCSINNNAYILMRYD